MKRLGIFCFYDKNGIVDDYVEYLLKDICLNLDRLIIVCNGVLSKDGRRRLEQFSHEVIVRENKGFDAGAWQDVIVNCLGFNEVRKYDELVLFNDTFYGPFYPFKLIFDKMENKQVDFWGITIHGNNKDGWGICSYGYIPEHIQSYFIVFEKKIINSYSFVKYWQNLPKINSFAEAVCFNEAVLTKTFSDLGFTYDVLCDTRQLDKSFKYAGNYYIYNPAMLMENYCCPILKRKAFITENNELLNINNGTEIHKCLSYIKNNTDYDVNYIYSYLIRTGNAFFLKHSLNLNYVLPTEGNTVTEPAKIAVIAYLNNFNMLTTSLYYLKNIGTIDTIPLK